MKRSWLLPLASLFVPLFVPLFVIGCGGDDDGGGMPDAAATIDGGGGADAAPADFTALVTADWTMPPGTEGYVCARVTVPEDTYVAAFRPIAPLGTHHTALSLDTTGGADGTFPCQAGTIGFQILFGSGVGTTAFAMPEGIAFKIPAGAQVLLNLHLYNTGDTDLTGTSGIDIQAVAPVDAAHEAEVVYVGNFNLTIPPGEATQQASCTMTDATTVFGVFPHMHKLGTHMTGVAQSGGSQLVLSDRPYSFEEQLNHRVDPLVPLVAGDVVTTTCFYDNTTGATVNFGDSSDDEMCILGLYRYPARGGSSICFN